MLAIEIDGDSHIGKEVDDKIRQYELENDGVQFLRFSDLEIKKEMNKVLKEIEIWITENKDF